LPASSLLNVHGNRSATTNAADMKQLHATDVLANERTFLAYARTALAFVGFGFVIARFSLFTREFAVVTHTHSTSPSLSTTFGTVMALAGVACGIYGAYRYVAAARALRAGSVSPMPDASAILIAAIIGVIGLVVTWTLYVFR
jgi:putative membrane protein